jgi:hypothetical protein
VRIVKCLGHGCSVEATADICDVDPRTVGRILAQAGRRAEDFHRLRLDRLDAAPEAVQLDELHGRITPPAEEREVPFVRADAWTASQPASRWTRLTVRAGEKGPLEVDAMTVRVRAKQDGRIGPEERLVVIRSVGESRIDYALSNAGSEVPLVDLVRVQRQRHRIEEIFEAGNGEAGLDHYEVRSWVGWHHHLTLALVALWFLCLERRQLGGENPGDHGVAGPSGLHEVAPPPGAEPRGDRRGDHAGAAA